MTRVTKPGDPLEAQVQKILGSEFGGGVSKHAIIVVQEDSKGLAAFGILQPIWHAEPIWVREDKRGGASLFHILRALRDNLPGYANGVLCGTYIPRVARLCKRLGLEPLKGWQTFRWMR